VDVDAERRMVISVRMMTEMGWRGMVWLDVGWIGIQL
jgi:hypothetical protein